MITIMYNNIEETFDNPYSALSRVKELESRGEVVTWRCLSSFDNDYMWENY